MELINKEIAESEISKWLDFKKVSSKRRESKQENIDALIDAVIDGHLVLNENNSFTHTLKFPIGENGQITKLEYKPRLEVKEIQLQMQGIKSTDLHGMILSYVSALTGKAKGIVSAMDSEDYTIAQGIAIFFM